MIAICKSNEAFEDILTAGKHYTVLELRNGSVRVIDDRGSQRWFGLSRFGIQKAAQAEAVAC